MKARRRHGALGALGLVAALVLLASVLRAALHDVSQAFDSLYYHVPFAARFAGISSPEAYVFSPDNQERLKGYALFAEKLQGLLYLATGRPEGANLLSFASAPLLAMYMARRYRVPFGLTVFALFALPLVMTHATSAYVDLPANACAAAFVLEAYALASRRVPARAKALVRVLVLGAVTAAMRFQLAPTVVLGLGLVAFAAVRARKGRTSRLAVVALGAPFVFAKPLSNLVLYGNPVYPVELTVLGRSLPFHETRYVASPDYLANSPQPLRFLCSLAEIGLPPLGTPSRWTVDQYAPPGTDASRMGGTFAPYLFAMLALFVALAFVRGKKARGLVALVVGLTAIVAPSPQSHDLRYYMVWPIVLVCATLVLAVETSRDRRLLARALRVAVPTVVMGAFVVVAHTTSYEWIAPSGSTFEEMLAKRVDKATIDGIKEGETVCLWRPPLTFYYSAQFHGRRYRVIEGETPAACGTARVVP